MQLSIKQKTKENVHKMLSPSAAWSVIMYYTTFHLIQPHVYAHSSAQHSDTHNMDMCNDSFSWAKLQVMEEIFDGNWV